MFSPQQISKTTALALALGAVAAPAASAMPIGGIPTRPTSITRASNDHQTNPLVQARRLKASNPYFYRDVSVNQLANKLAPPVYSQQDKQLVPNVPAPVSSPAARTSTPSAGFDWAYAGLGGAAALSLLGVGGALAISQRRSRPTATVAATS